MDGWVKVCVQMCANIYVRLYIYISVCESTELKCKTEFSWESQYRCLISRPSSCAVDMFVILILNVTFKVPLLWFFGY